MRRGRGLVLAASLARAASLVIAIVSGCIANDGSVDCGPMAASSTPPQGASA